MAKSRMKKKAYLPTKIEKIDQQLISTALQEIATIHHTKSHEVVYEIGECLCRYFYDNDVERIRNNKPVHGKSLNKLISECGNKIDGLSRAWMYVAVNLLVDRKDLQDNESYEKLSVSHKHVLLQISGIEAKEELIKQITTNNLSVRKTIRLKDKYLEENPVARVTKKKEKKTFNQVINQAYLLAEPQYRHFKSQRYLKKLTKKQQQELRGKLEDKLKITKKKIQMSKPKGVPLGDSYRQLQDLLSAVNSIEEKREIERITKELQQAKEERIAKDQTITK